MIEVPEHYLEQKIFEKVGYAKKYSDGNMVGGCPFCLEGKSWGKKSRFNYYRDGKFFACFNCGGSWSAINFLKEVEGKTFKQVMIDIGSEFISGQNPVYNGVLATNNNSEPVTVILPADSIDLSDRNQTDFYKGDYFIETALKTIKERGLDTASYGQPLYLSREDFIHRNRIIIPFYDQSGDLTFYQSRAQTKKQEDMGKYLSCLDGKKSLFGINSLQMDAPAFILEGPLDCFFVRNSIGGGGLKLNQTQYDIIDNLRAFYEIIWCLDNDFGNEDVRNRYLELIKSGERVFLWGSEYVGCKDFNDYCLNKNITEIPIDQILERVYSGPEAIREFSKLV